MIVPSAFAVDLVLLGRDTASALASCGQQSRQAYPPEAGLGIRVRSVRGACASVFGAPHALHSRDPAEVQPIGAAEHWGDATWSRAQ